MSRCTEYVANNSQDTSRQQDIADCFGQTVMGLQWSQAQHTECKISGQDKQAPAGEQSGLIHPCPKYGVPRTI